MKIKQDVMEVLSTMRCDGAKAVIANPKLDRKLYTDTNKVLVALGGKWSRKAAAHVFDGDAADRIDGAITLGEVVAARDLGFFPTPPDLAMKLAAELNISHGEMALEPSAGTGVLVDALIQYDALVTAVEYDEGRRAALQATARNITMLTVSNVADFMDFGSGVDDLIGSRADGYGSFDVVLMNPPFCKVGKGNHLDHVEHAFAHLRRGGRMRAILPSGVRFRQDRRHREFREWAERHGSFHPLPENTFRISGTSVSTVVLAIDGKA